VSEIPNQLQPATTLRIDLIKLVKQHGAWTLIQEFTDRCTGPEIFRVRPEY
jgi:hypothetical protein